MFGNRLRRSYAIGRIVLALSGFIFVLVMRTWIPSGES
jgi:hypothetical protein